MNRIRADPSLQVGIPDPWRTGQGNTVGTRQEIGILLLILLLLLPWLLQQPWPHASVAPFANADSPQQSERCSHAFEVQGEVDRPGVICSDGQMLDRDWHAAVGLPAACQSAKTPSAGKALKISLGPGEECQLTQEPMLGIHRLLVGLPVDLNSATLADLEAVPGIGPTLAQRIHAVIQQQGRFASVDDLIQVKGIGPKRLLQFRPFFTIEPARPTH